MIKKWIASIAAVLVLLSVPTTVASAASADASTIITTEVSIPDISIAVTVPSESNAYINPQSIPVMIGGTVNTGQIISEPAYIENLSVVPVLVSVAVIGEEKGGLNLRSSTTQGTITRSKRAFIYFQLQAVDDPDNVVWDDGYDADKDIVVKTITKKKEDYVKLAAFNQDERFGAFRLTGDCVVEPKTPWTEEDGFTAKIMFSFKTTSFD